MSLLVAKGGKGSYETIAAGQTKRVLKSNGRGSVFYENLTIASPSDPIYSSDITGLNMTGGNVCFYAMPNGDSAMQAGYELPYKTYSTGAIEGFDVWRSAYITSVSQLVFFGYLYGDINPLTQAHKVTMRADNYWTVCKIKDGYVGNNNALRFTPEEWYSNIPSNISENDFKNIIVNAKSIGLYFRKEWA